MINPKKAIIKGTNYDLNQRPLVHQTDILLLGNCTCYNASQTNTYLIFESSSSINVYFIGYLMKVESQAKGMSNNNSVVKVKR